MDIFNHSHVNKLLDVSQNINLTGYIPTLRSNGTEENRIAIKNFLQNTENLLKENGFSEELCKAWLKPIKNILLDEENQRFLSDCIAIFRIETHCSIHYLPIQVKAYEGLSKDFYLVPVTPLLDVDNSAYVITVSPEKIRVLHFTDTQIEELDFSEDFPQNLTEAHWHIDRNRSLQSHGSRTEEMHGHGAGKDSKEEDIKRFYRDVKTGLEGFFKSKTDDIILAGVDKSVSLFKKVFGNKHVLDNYITGNHDDTSILDLHFHGKSVLDYKQRKEKYSLQIDNLHPSKKVKQSGAIVNKSLKGLVDTLYLNSADVQISGKVFLNGLAAEGDDEGSNTLETDYVNEALINTLKTGGQVCVNPRATHGKEMLATLRF